MLALDLGSFTGWALRRPDGACESGVLDLTLVPGMHPGTRFNALRHFLTGTLRRVHALDGELGVLRYERVQFAGPNGVRAVQLWGGLEATVLSWCAMHDVEAQAIGTSTLKKLATGNGHAAKPAMVERANELRRQHPFAEPRPVRSHDEADAICLLFVEIDDERRAA